MSLMTCFLTLDIEGDRLFFYKNIIKFIVLAFHSQDYSILDFAQCLSTNHEQP